MTRAGQQSEGYLILPTEWAGTLVEGNDKEATGKERNLLAQKLARELHGHRWRFVGAEPLGPEVPDYPDWAPSVPRDCSLYRLRRDEHRLLPRPSPELGARQGLAQVGREMDELLGCLIDVRDENERGATRTRGTRRRSRQPPKGHPPGGRRSGTPGPSRRSTERWTPWRRA